MYSLVYKARKLKICSVNLYYFSPASFMEKKSCFFNKYINIADEVIRFQLSPSIFKAVYMDHCCFQQGCKFTYLVSLIVDLMSPKFLNMHQGTVAYKVGFF